MSGPEAQDRDAVRFGFEKEGKRIDRQEKAAGRMFDAFAKQKEAKAQAVEDEVYSGIIFDSGNGPYGADSCPKVPDSDSPENAGQNRYQDRLSIRILARIRAILSFQGMPKTAFFGPHLRLRCPVFAFFAT